MVSFVKLEIITRNSRKSMLQILSDFKTQKVEISGNSNIEMCHPSLTMARSTESWRDDGFDL